MARLIGSVQPSQEAEHSGRDSSAGRDVNRPVPAEEVHIPGDLAAEAVIVETLGDRPVIHLNVDVRIGAQQLQAPGELLGRMVHDDRETNRLVPHSSLAATREA